MKLMWGIDVHHYLPITSMVTPQIHGNVDCYKDVSTRALFYLVESIVNSEGFAFRGSNCGLVKEASLYGTSSFG